MPFPVRTDYERVVNVDNIAAYKSRNQVRRILQESVMTSFSNDREIIERYIQGDIMPLNNPVIVAVMDRFCGKEKKRCNSRWYSGSSYIFRCKYNGTNL